VVDLSACLVEVADICRPIASQKGLSFALDIADGVSVCRTDPAKVRQILLNLLDNAVKFTDEGEVRLEVRHAAGKFEITVRDTGIGIEPEYREAIFDPFWQVSQPSTRTRGGTGLGLTVCRRLATLLGGDITVASTPGAGTAFTLSLPTTEKDEG
jgi:signal transduction histidine kinase